MSKLKVLYILHDIQIGGVEVALVSAIPELYKEFNLKVIVLGKIDPKMIAHLSEEEKSCFYKFDYPLLSYPLFIFKIAFFVLKISPQIMICSLWRASLLGILIKKLKPSIQFISFIHNTTFFHKADHIFTAKAIYKADCIFTDSVATADFVRSRFKPECNIVVISFFTQISPSEKSNRAYDKDFIRFMFLGRINNVKNLPLAVDAINYLRIKGLNVILDIYGRDDGALKELLTYIETHKLESAIIFRGELGPTEKNEAFKNYHFLIQLSSNEGMAMSVAEAMQNGLVCFVTPVGEIPNYAEDMQTAVFANIWEKQQWDNTMTKIEAVVRDQELYNKISNNCFQQFKNVQTYSKSLVSEIATFHSMKSK